MGMHRTLRRFTPEDDAAITAAFLSYEPTISIARRLTRSEGAIRQRLLHLGLILQRKEKMIAKRMAGMTLEEIAAQYGVSRERIRQLTDPHYEPSTPLNPLKRMGRLEKRRQQLLRDQVEALFAMWEAGGAEVREEFLRRIGVRYNQPGKRSA